MWQFFVPLRSNMIYSRISLDKAGFALLDPFTRAEAVESGIAAGAPHFCPLTKNGSIADYICISPNFVVSLQAK